MNKITFTRQYTARIHQTYQFDIDELTPAERVNLYDMTEGDRKAGTVGELDELLLEYAEMSDEAIEPVPDRELRIRFEGDIPGPTVKVSRVDLETLRTMIVTRNRDYLAVLDGMIARG